MKGGRTGRSPPQYHYAQAPTSSSFHGLLERHFIPSDPDRVGRGLAGGSTAVRGPRPQEEVHFHPRGARRGCPHHPDRGPVSGHHPSLSCVLLPDIWGSGVGGTGARPGGCVLRSHAFAGHVSLIDHGLPGG